MITVEKPFDIIELRKEYLRARSGAQFQAIAAKLMNLCNWYEANSKVSTSEVVRGISRIPTDTKGPR